MVERPIKKSERQSQIKTDGTPTDGTKTDVTKTDVTTSHNRPQPAEKSQRKGAKGKSKKASSKDELKSPVNPALARPPKPPRLNMQRKPEPEPEAEIDITGTSELELGTTVLSEE